MSDTSSRPEPADAAARRNPEVTCDTRRTRQSAIPEAVVHAGDIAKGVHASVGVIGAMKRAEPPRKAGAAVLTVLVERAPRLRARCRCEGALRGRDLSECLRRGRKRKREGERGEQASAREHREKSHGVRW